MAIAYGIAYQSSFGTILKLIFFTVGVEFLLCGIVISFITWYGSNKYLLEHQIHTLEQKVEWMYCFDVHTNAFFSFFIVTYVVQFFLLRITTQEGFIYRFIGNTVYLTGLLYYFYVTFLGFHGINY
jgi:hypothetical protein